MTTLVLIPVYDDWTAVARLLVELDRVLPPERRETRIVLVNDGSESDVREFAAAIAAARLDVDVLHLRRNLGHQRAIAIGLAYLEGHLPCDAVVVMDGDGEDRPEDVPKLLDALERGGRRRIVFAARSRRSENIAFVIMYNLYKILHFLLTGERVRVGNFSAVPRALLGRLVSVSDLWNHYAAAVFKSRLPYDTIETSRGVRYSGKSRMDLVALVTHGLSAMSVFGDRIGVRLLAATLAGALAIVLAIAGAAALVAFTGMPVPEWAPYAIVLLVVLLLQTGIVALSFVFIILSARGSSTFLPLRDYEYFVAGFERIASARSQPVAAR